MEELNILDKKINDKNTSINNIKLSLIKMRNIVNQMHLDYNKAQEVLNKNVENLTNTINNIERIEDEYSTPWVEFMNNKYDIELKKDDTVEFGNNSIKITDNLRINQTDILKLIENKLILQIPQLELKTTFQKINSLPFTYSSDFIKSKNKPKHHLGPLKNLEADLLKLKNHPQLLEEEKNKISTTIIYNIILHQLIQKYEFIKN